MDLPAGVESIFRFILIAAKRARQLQAGAKPLVQTSNKKATKVAMMEVEAGLVPVEDIEPVSENGEKAKRAKSGK
jgi:DNA-directed RNA polymerase subunit omega